MEFSQGKHDFTFTLPGHVTCLPYYSDIGHDGVKVNCTNENNVGSTCIFTCNEYNALQDNIILGGSDISCGQDGTWERMPPVACSRK